MTQEEKQLLLKDLSARLPYGVKVQFYLPNYQTNFFDEKIGKVFEIGDMFTHVHCDGIDYLPNTSRIKPYLRPMSSMTEEEAEEVCRLENYENRIICVIPNHTYHFTVGDSVLDWLNEHHFDYRGLIEKGLALEAPEGMYKTE